MDLNALFTDEGMRKFTATQRDQHLEDARQYGQLADIVEQRLKATPIDGDRPLSEWQRTRKVVGKLRRMEKASRRAAASAEALYATYVHQVLELPQRRETAAARKAARRARRGGRLHGAVATSLGKSAAQLSGVNAPAASADGAVNDGVYLPVQSPAGAPVEAPAPAPISGIGDFFPAPKRGVS
ncbi:hypothetical protein ACFWA9_04635 [Kitasatospora sp. NPDC059973]|uniref:hypothetical protein n=1 Tax=Kitasatospora sp. NPDC059973 TaxID=3347020 RepID=UPI0036927236